MGLAARRTSSLRNGGSKTFALHPCHVLVGRVRKRERAQGKDPVTRHDARGADPSVTAELRDTCPIQQEANDMAAQLEHNVATNRYEKSNGKQ